jgi:hypothetical protein
MGLFTTAPDIELEGTREAFIGRPYEAVLVVTTAEDIPCSGIDLRLLGRRGWSVSQGKSSVSNRETSPDATFMLWRGGGTLARGTHRFPVRLQIPGDVVPSHALGASVGRPVADRGGRHPVEDRPTRALLPARDAAAADRRAAHADRGAVARRRGPRAAGRAGAAIVGALAGRADRGHGRVLQPRRRRAGPGAAVGDRHGRPARPRPARSRGGGVGPATRRYPPAAPASARRWRSACPATCR